MNPGHYLRELSALADFTRRGEIPPWPAGEGFTPTERLQLFRKVSELFRVDGINSAPMKEAAKGFASRFDKNACAAALFRELDRALSDAGAAAAELSASELLALDYIRSADFGDGVVSVVLPTTQGTKTVCCGRVDKLAQDHPLLARVPDCGWYRVGVPGGGVYEVAVLGPPREGFIAGTPPASPLYRWRDSLSLTTQLRGPQKTREDDIERQRREDERRARLEFESSPAGREAALEAKIRDKIKRELKGEPPEPAPVRRSEARKELERWQQILGEVK
jgi:hypothetical protein